MAIRASALRAPGGTRNPVRSANDPSGIPYTKNLVKYTTDEIPIPEPRKYSDDTKTTPPINTKPGDPILSAPVDVTTTSTTPVPVTTVTPELPKPPSQYRQVQTQIPYQVWRMYYDAYVRRGVSQQDAIRLVNQLLRVNLPDGSQFTKPGSPGATGRWKVQKDANGNLGYYWDWDKYTGNVGSGTQVAGSRPPQPSQNPADVWRQSNPFPWRNSAELANWMRGLRTGAAARPEWMSPQTYRRMLINPQNVNRYWFDLQNEYRSYVPTAGPTDAGSGWMHPGYNSGGTAAMS